MATISELDRLLDLPGDLEPGDVMDIFASSLLAGRCALLERASEARRLGTQRALLTRIQSDAWSGVRTLGAGFFFGGRIDSPLSARQKLIHAALADVDAARLQTLLADARAIYEACWWEADAHAADVANRLSGAMPRGEPKWFHCLPNQRFESIFRELASPGTQHLEWMDPALSLVGETMVRLCADAAGRLSASRIVQTWVLLVVSDEDAHTQSGVIARLTLERIEGGHGYLYPDPLCNGYCRTMSSFQLGLFHAWYAEIWPRLDQVEFDIRWSIEVGPSLDAYERNRLLALPLTGRSAEGAIACALRALYENEPLDPNTAITAQLAHPFSENRALTCVGGVQDKLLAREFGAGRRPATIWDVVLATDQQPSDDILKDHHLSLHRMGDLDAAFNRLSQWSVMTQLANVGLVEEATKFLSKNCHGETAIGYIPPQLSLRKTGPRAPGTTCAPAADAECLRDRAMSVQYEPLSTTQWQSLVSGQFANRVRIFADSGMGKTMLLAYCEAQIARASIGLLPLRLTRLSYKPWDDEEKLVANLARRLQPHLPNYEQATRVAWLRRVRRAGKLVFLLDALDQTTHLDQLVEWLDGNAGGVAECSVMITGRRSTIGSAVFDAAEWSTLRIESFGREQIVQHLGGNAAANRLLPSHTEKWERWKKTIEEHEEDVRRAQWQDLLKIPMLLDMMKRLAIIGRPELTNRERLYHAAIEWTESQQGFDGLIAKGFKSAKAAGGGLGKLTPRRIREVLSFAAWNMVEQGNFQGFSTRAQFDASERELLTRFQHLGADDLTATLDQINLITRGDLIDHDEDGFKWRHRSFCEYYAGIYLASALTPEQQTQAIERVQHVASAVERAKAKSATGGQNTISPVEQWHWVYRFALSYAHTLEDRAVLHHLANDLIRRGNPQVVVDALESDGIQIGTDLEVLARWLVSQDGSDKRDYTSAWHGDDEAPTLRGDWLPLLEGLFDRDYRNGVCLPPAWQLVNSTLDDPQLSARAHEIRDGFLAEHSACYYPDIWQFEDSFQTCKPPEPGDRMRERLPEPGLAMSEFPVTNAAFECFDPSHFWWRDDVSRDDDQPALFVNWHMASLFCEWLSCGAKDHVCRLPTWGEWEFACRAGSRGKYWWGDEVDRSRCNADQELGRTLGRDESTSAYRNPFGLYHMSGNQYEWCEDEDEEVLDGETSGFRLICGGAWNVWAAEGSSSSWFFEYPAGRSDNIGFRVLLEILDED